MRFVAGFAGQACGMLVRVHLRESLRFSGVRFVTADAKHGGVEFGGRDRGVIGMFREWPVAGLAVDSRMPAILLLIQDVRMAAFAGLVAGEIHRPRGNLGDGISAIVSILSETLRHKKRAHPEKHQDADHENRGQPKQVACISEDIH